MNFLLGFHLKKFMNSDFDAATQMMEFCSLMVEKLGYATEVKRDHVTRQYDVKWTPLGLSFKAEIQRAHGMLNPKNNETGFKLFQLVIGFIAQAAQPTQPPTVN